MNMSYAYPKILVDNNHASLCSPTPKSGLILDGTELPLVAGLRYLGSGLLSAGHNSVFGSAHPYEFLRHRYHARIQANLALPLGPQDVVLKLNFHSSFLQCYSNLYHQFLPY